MAWSLKKNTICSLAACTKMEELNKNKLILFTASGTIYGDVYKETDDDTDHLTSENFLQKTIQESSKIYIEKNAIEGPIPGNDGCIILENVTILRGENRTNIPSLIVFLDQIIAASIGNPD